MRTRLSGPDKIPRMPSILVLGATGLVGRAAVDLLLDDSRFERVVTLTRRPLGRPPHPRLEQKVSAMTDLEDDRAAFRCDAILSALGTTIAKAGSQEAFRAVDFDLPLRAARMALAEGARHFLLVSSIGADAGSRMFYTRVKGELEDAILALGFRSVTIVRPSLLVGTREDLRPTESIGRYLMALAPARYRPVHGREVAAALLAAALADHPGATILESEQIRDPFPASRS